MALSNKQCKFIVTKAYQAHYQGDNKICNKKFSFIYLFIYDDLCHMTIVSPFVIFICHLICGKLTEGDNARYTNYA